MSGERIRLLIIRHIEGLVLGFIVVILIALMFVR